MKKSVLFITALLICYFQLLTFNSSAQYTKLLDFSGTNGNQPSGSLISDGAFLYGMTKNGGTNSVGVIFKIKPDGTGYAKLLDFAGAANGSYPSGDLISDGTFLYGMTKYGGTNNFGTIFKIMPDGTGYSKLLDFDGTTNGKYPSGSLISDGIDLCGLTEQGGANGLGVIFKIKSDGTAYSNLLDFAGATNGSSPLGSLVSDGTFLYGMTWGGGINNYGVLFKIMPDGTGFAKLVDFSGTTNGKSPYGSLIYDGTFLYGMTSFGGTSSMGVLFKMKPDGTGFTKLLNFSGVANGKAPLGSLFSDGTFLYGMTQYGGTYSNGVLFKIKPDGTAYSKLLNFAGFTNGQNPTGSVISIGGFLYGMTGQGGAGNGTVFKYNPYCTAVTFSQTKTFCVGQNFNVIVGNHTYSTIGTYTDVLRAVNTCDSIVTTHIKVLGNTLFQSPTVCSGQNITVGSHTYIASGTYTDVFTSLVNGCDSTVTTHLAILPANTFTQSKTVCAGQSITVGSHAYSISAIYHDTLTSLVNGCDSMVTTHLTVLPSYVSSSSQTFTKCAGESVTVGTLTYTTSGTYTYLFLGNGCDSLVTTHLTILPPNILINQSLTKCSGESVTVGSHTYMASGTYNDTLTSLVNGCDSIVTTHLTIKPSNTFIQSPVKCIGQSITVGSHLYSSTATYHDTLTSLVNGCDSMITTHLTVLSSSIDSSSQTITTCAGQSVTVGTATYTTSGTFTYHFSSGGCDSMVKTHLTVLPVNTFTQSHTVCAGQSVTVGSNTHAINGTYTDTLISFVNGCDSIVVTHLTVLPANTFIQSHTVCAGKSVTVAGHTYNTSGTYIDVFTSSINGCDSTVTTHLIISPSNIITQSPTICAGAGQSVIVGIHTYNANGTYSDTLTSPNGCDSVVITHLTVLSSSVDSSSQTFTKCAGQSVTVGTDTYTTSGTYTYNFSGNVCDSMVITHLTLLPANTFTQSLTLCAGQSVNIESHIYSVSGTYTNVFTSLVNGCDSIVTTYLIINDTSISVSGVVLTANAVGATYQWVNCNNGNTPISGQTDQSFTATANGSYAVIVTQNLCSGTSTCHNITNVGIAENNFATTINIYPNPFTSQTTIEFTQEQKNTTIKIVDVLGKEVKMINFSGKQLIIEKGEMQTGIYFVQIIDENKNFVNKKIVVQ